MSELLNLTATYVVITCCHEGCGVSFGVPSWWEQSRRKDHVSWTCINGHKQHFHGESYEEKAKREVVQLRALLDQEKARTEERRRERDAVQRRLSATQGVVTRTKKRVGHGVCPCCKRTISQLARHMKTQHPEYAAEIERHDIGIQ